MKYVKNEICAHAQMLPSFESQKTVTEKTTKGEAQAYSPLETPFCSPQQITTVGAITNRPCI